MNTDVRLSSLLYIRRCQDLRVCFTRYCNCLTQCFWHSRGKRGENQSTWFDTNYSNIVRNRRLQVADSNCVPASCLSRPGVRLGDIRTSNLADIKTRCRSTDLFFKIVQRRATIIGNLAITDNIHECNRTIKQHLLLNRQQVLIAGPHGRISFAQCVFSPEPVKHRLGQIDLEAAVQKIGFSVRDGSFDGRSSSLISFPYVGICRYGRTPPGLCLRHLLVGRTLACLIGLQLRIADICLRQRRRDGFGACRCRPVYHCGDGHAQSGKPTGMQSQRRTFYITHSQAPDYITHIQPQEDFTPFVMGVPLSNCYESSIVN